jgi:hypothetical protein
MPINSVTEMFTNGATISSFSLTIPSGSLVSCPLPSSGNPNEVAFGLLETVHRAVASGLPANITTSASTTLINSTTLRRAYTFNVDLSFNNSAIIESLDVKPEA